MKTKRHLTVQIVVLVCILAAGAVLVSWLMNVLFLERFYVREKKSTMVTDFQILSNASTDGYLASTDFDAYFDYICDNGNVTVLVLDAWGYVVRTSATDFSSLQQELVDLFQNVNLVETLEGEEEYEILTATDTRTEIEYIELVGTLPNGELLLMRTELEKIHEGAQLSNRLLLRVGILMIVVSVVVGAFLARRITRPILQLTGISEKMVGLDFEAKYVPGAWRREPTPRIDWKRGKREDRKELPDNEIDLLGDRMNQLSATLEETISELKSANAELTRDIEQRVEIDEMRKQFLSDVSHELKTPLALIQGYAEGLEECVNEDAESRDFYCSVIVDEAEKMNQMVQKLLTLNQLEFGNEPAVMERFDLTELIRGVCEASRLLMEKQGITLDMSGLDAQYVWGDSFGIEEVITNYVSNAIHHCEGEKKIRISYTKRGDLLRVSVFNTGMPIPAEDLDRVWDKFYKVDKAHTREYGGSGIGLSIVKAVMDSHGQQCGVENHADGVEFWMELETK